MLMTRAPASLAMTVPSATKTFLQRARVHSQCRAFSTGGWRLNWLQPKKKLVHKDHKGRPRVATGGSTRGTTVEWGDYGLRLVSHGLRMSAHQLRNGEAVIRQRLRGTNFRLMPRIHAGTAVFKKGNESRMGTGKGAFDHWAARVPVSRIVFELKGDAHEQVIRDAMRLAGNKLPGQYEFVKRGDPPVIGITQLKPGFMADELQRPRKKLPLETTSHRIPTPP